MFQSIMRIMRNLWGNCRKAFVPIALIPAVPTSLPSTGAAFSLSFEGNRPEDRPPARTGEGHGQRHGDAQPSPPADAAGIAVRFRPKASFRCLSGLLLVYSLKSVRKALFSVIMELNRVAGWGDGALSGLSGRRQATDKGRSRAGTA